MYQLAGWFTDLMDVFRVESVTTDGLTTQERVQVLSAVPCRVYAPAKNSINLRDGAATTRADEKLACGIDVDIQAGDEIIVTRGGVLGHTRTERYIASKPGRADLIYILMKPLEWVFLLYLYLTDTRPEVRINRQYKM